MSDAYEIRVCMDVGSQSHQVAIGLSTGEILEEFGISHTPEDIALFFKKIEGRKEQLQLPVVVAMESYNGHARPLETGWKSLYKHTRNYAVLHDYMDT